MIPGIDLIEFIKAVSIIGVLLVIFSETGLMIGFFLPGDSLLFTTGFLIYSGVLGVNINFVVPFIFLAAVIGNTTGYTFGRRIGHKIFNRPNAKIFKQEYVKKSQDFYEKYGGKTIILAQFIPIIRTFAPLVAGVGKMDFRKFITYNIIGAALWTGGVTYAGYYLGSVFESMGLQIDQVLLPIVALIILLSITPPIYHILKDEKNRKSLCALIKRQFKFFTK
jgi:membrane-associated protein